MRKTWREVWESAQIQLVNALDIEADVAHLEVRFLLASTLNCSHAWLLAHGDDLACVPDIFFQHITYRCQGVPLAYVLGYQDFYGLRIKVTESTLIPRSDSEVLVETALQIIPQNATWKIIDLGSGSGAIALAIAKHRPLITMLATDISLPALRVAQENARNLQIKNIHHIVSDWFSALCPSQFDLVISNPPYIATSDHHLHHLVHEPRVALVSGKDGLDALRHIIEHSSTYLKRQGILIMEHGYQQAPSVLDLMNKAGFCHCRTVKDWHQRDRLTMGKLQ